MVWPNKKSRLDEVIHPVLTQKKVRLFMLRDDLLHPGISGNKWRKLKYNVLEAKRLQRNAIITVGGFHSNHIAAVAHAGKEFGFRTIGLVQGYANQPESPTIQQARGLGMEIHLVNKLEFAQIQESQAKEWMDKHPDAFYVPMGGGNTLGVKGCVEIADEVHADTTHITTSCGTGSTVAGIAIGAHANIQVQAFTPFKNGSFIRADILNYIANYPAKQHAPMELMTQYAGGKFGTLNAEMAQFITQFYNDTGIALDGIYNGKMVYGIFDLVANNHYPEGSVITAVHTGGVQGNPGLNARYRYYLPE